ncbi:MAG TPA: hypothetical protein VKY73_21045 [Polyangiaceae bacterium]|nr:hypothetical protein [Polyangiaceae bacterium]
MSVSPDQLLSPRSEDCVARPEHLDQIGPIHTLLAELNDPCASASRLTLLVAQIPLLALRCVHALLVRRPALRGATLSQALSLLGNRGLERELLQVLEDLTVLRAEVESES